MQSAKVVTPTMTAFDQPNPLHQVSRPDTSWTTVNAAENIPGVMTPLGFDFWMNAVDLGVRGAFHWIGVLPASAVRIGAVPDERFGGVFYGRFAGNVDQFRLVADLTPGTDGAAFEMDVFGSTREQPIGRQSPWRYPLIAAKAPVVVARLPHLIPLRSAQTQSWWQHATSAAEQCRPAVDRLQEAADRMAESSLLQITVSMLALALFDRLGRLAKQAGHPELHLQLAAGYGGMEETRMISALNSIARNPTEEQTLMATFLSTYGARCDGENEISARSWREQPERIAKLVEQYRNAPSRVDPLDQAEDRISARVRAERTLLSALPRWRRPPARLLLRVARSYIPLREEGKHLMAMAMDAGRCAARARGAELVSAGIIDDPEDVFLLTMKEVLGDAPPDAREMIADRKSLRAQYADMNVPQSWVGNPAPVYPQTRPGERVSEVTGVPAAFGCAEGIARVVLDADGCDDLEPDEILVCRTTDPSWASAFHLVSAVVIDIGGAGSHGAIVSRELGLPCVINTRTGTEDIHTGDRLRVDGSTGIVTILKYADD